MDAVGRAQIVWAETKDLRVPAGGDPDTLSVLRRHVAAIAGEAEKSFSRFESLPARDDASFAQHVADCAAAAEAATPQQVGRPRMFTIALGTALRVLRTELGRATLCGALIIGSTALSPPTIARAATIAVADQITIEADDWWQEIPSPFTNTLVLVSRRAP